MSQKIDEVSFWKERLRRAKKEGMLHYSVYLANPKLWKEILDAHLEIIAKEINPNDFVLDAGCGYGRLSPYFIRYAGVDFSPDLLAEARTLFPEKVFIEADLKALPFEDNTFDVAICTSIKGMIKGNLGAEAWTPIEKELKRVAKKILVLEYGSTDLGIENEANEYEII